MPHKLSMLRLLVGALSLAAGLALPATVHMPVDQYRTIPLLESTCSRVDLDADNDILVKLQVRVHSRPSDFAVLASTTTKHEQGLSFTMDKYGNVFVAVPHLTVDENGRSVALLTHPFALNQTHDFGIRISKNRIIDGYIDDQSFPLKEVDSPTLLRNVQSQIEISRFCLGSFSKSSLDGDVHGTLEWRSRPMEIQTGFLQAVLALISLCAFLQAIRPGSPQRLRS